MPFHTKLPTACLNMPCAALCKMWNAVQPFYVAHYHRSLQSGSFWHWKLYINLPSRCLRHLPQEKNYLPVIFFSILKPRKATTHSQTWPSTFECLWRVQEYMIKFLHQFSPAVTFLTLPASKGISQSRVNKIIQTRWGEQRAMLQTAQ